MPADSALTVRAIRAEETDEFLRVLCTAFGILDDAARPLFHADPFFDLSHKRALWQKGTLISCLTVVPVMLWLGERWVPIGGIAGVATRPENQGLGFASALLKATARAITSELGYTASGLMTDCPEFYARLGWRAVFSAPRRRVFPSQLHGLSTLPVRELVSGDSNGWQEIGRLHAQSESREGACRRDARRWRVIQTMTPGRRAFMCSNGYAIADSAPDTLRVQELVALTPAARTALLAFLAAQQVAELDFSAVAAVHLNGIGQPGAADPDFMLHPPLSASRDFAFSPLDQF